MLKFIFIRSPQLHPTLAYNNPANFMAVVFLPFHSTDSTRLHPNLSRQQILPPIVRPLIQYLSGTSNPTGKDNCLPGIWQGLRLSTETNFGQMFQSHLAVYRLWAHQKSLLSLILNQFASHLWIHWFGLTNNADGADHDLHWLLQ